MILTTISILAAMTLNQPAPALASNLNEALADERYAQAYYKAGIDRWNVSRPLTNLVRAEGNHIDSVSFLMKKYGVKISANPFDKRSRENKESYWLRLGIPATKEEGFAKAIKLEKEQGPLYDKLSVGMPDDVKQVFARLKDVSVNRHLVTLERAASGAGSGNGFGGGNGPGNGRGNGQGNGGGNGRRGQGQGQGQGRGGQGQGRGNPPF
jgi:hypothetical protein